MKVPSNASTMAEHCVSNFTSNLEPYRLYANLASIASLTLTKSLQEKRIHNAFLCLIYTDENLRSIKQYKRSGKRKKNLTPWAPRQMIRITVNVLPYPCSCPLPEQEVSHNQSEELERNDRYKERRWRKNKRRKQIEVESIIQNGKTSMTHWSEKSSQQENSKSKSD